MGYTSTLRRRARQLRRVAVASGRAPMWRDGIVVPATWWDGHPNFGDDLTPWLLPFYGVLPVHRVAGRARLAGIGSILEFLPPSYDGAIWGSGLMRDAPHPLPDARVLAVRGPLTRERIGAAADVALGDPGILVARHVRRPAVRWDVGLVPHGHHRAHEEFLSLAADAGRSVRVINVHAPAARVVREIASCRRIVTTSLHGLVTADAFGIPALWTMLEPALTGGDFKFRDYEAVITPGASRFVAFDPGVPLEELLGRTASADRAIVDRVGDGLEAALAGLHGGREDFARFPVGASRLLVGRERPDPVSR